MPHSTSGLRIIVGRGAELATIRASLHDAFSARGSTVLVCGDAGIGKTRLVTELADEAMTAGAVVLWGRCIELVGAGVPYFALLDALRSTPRASAGQDVGSSRMPGSTVRHLLSLIGPGDRTGADAQLALFEAVRDTLAALAAATPAVVVLEDLHWADESTLDLITFIARSIRDRRILLLCTYRSDEVRPVDRLSRIAVELVRARDAQAVELYPLDSAHLRTVLENAAQKPVAGDLADAILARSGGNPFFAEELLAAAMRGEQAMPRLIRDVLQQRVAQLGSGGDWILRTAAAFRRDVPYRLLATLAPGTESGLDAMLRDAVACGLFTPDREAGTYRFRHALLAEAVLDTILPGEAERLHERIARALADNPALAGDQAAATLARHWAQARRPAEALAASARAAAQAEAVGGLAEALGHLEFVLDLWRSVPTAPELAGIDHAGALAWAAELADLTGRGPRAVELVRHAIELVEPTSDTVRASQLYERLASYLLPTGNRAAALAACHRAAALVPARPASAERARVLTSLANALMLSWQHADSLAVCEEALATARDIGDPRSAVRALGILGIDQCYLGRPEQAVPQAWTARRQAMAHGTPRDISHSHAMLCEVLIAAGQAAEAIQVADEGLALARQFGVERSFGALLSGYAAEASLDVGDWNRAEELLAGAQQAGAAFWGHYPRLVHAQLAIGRGAHDDAREHLAAGVQGERQPTSAARYSRLVAELALSEGCPRTAAEAVDAGLAGSAEGWSAVHITRLATLGLRAQAECAQLAGLRRDPPAVEAARRRAEELWRVVRRTAADAATVEATAWQAQAAAEHSRLSLNGSVGPWRTAVAGWDSVGRPYLAAYCRWQLVGALLSGPKVVTRDRRREAAAAARQAHEAASALGAAPLRRELEQLAERGRLDLDVPIPSPGPRAFEGLGLTAREGQVLRLLTRAYTNREIATELTISVKTASVHVSHILHKLGVTRRIEAAAVAHRLGVSDSVAASPPAAADPTPRGRARHR